VLSDLRKIQSQAYYGRSRIMSLRSKTSASFKAHYWNVVAECLDLFAPVDGVHKERCIKEARRGATDLTYHMEPVEAARLILGLEVVPEDVATRYRAKIQPRFARFAE
jgi:hypothetical protein